MSVFDFSELTIFKNFFIQLSVTSNSSTNGDWRTLNLIILLLYPWQIFTFPLHILSSKVFFFSYPFTVEGTKYYLLDSTLHWPSFLNNTKQKSDRRVFPLIFETHMSLNVSIEFEVTFFTGHEIQSLRSVNNKNHFDVSWQILFISCFFFFLPRQSTRVVRHPVFEFEMTIRHRPYSSFTSTDIWSVSNVILRILHPRLIDHSWFGFDRRPESHK